MQPNFNFNLSASILIFIGAIAFSYFTLNGWWALGGIFFLTYSKAYSMVYDLDKAFLLFPAMFLFITLVCFGFAVKAMNWSF